MPKAQSGDTVQVHYTGKLNDGTVFDSSEGREPLQFTLGSGQVIPGFESAVSGMEVGESKTAQIASDDAYGPYVPERVIAVSRQDFPEDISPEVGMRLAVTQPNGQQIPVTVTDVSEEDVTLDANHRLAGQDLVFDIQLVAIA